MRGVLTVICLATIAASTWLGAMFLVLHRPGFEQGGAMAVLFVLQSLLALSVANGWLQRRLWTVPAAAGALGLVYMGSRAVTANLNRPHFEGYALVVGFLLTLQGLLTLATSSSKVHQFGN